MLSAVPGHELAASQLRPGSVAFYECEEHRERQIRKSIEAWRYLDRHYPGLDPSIRQQIIDATENMK